MSIPFTFDNFNDYSKGPSDPRIYKSLDVCARIISISYTSRNSVDSEMRPSDPRATEVEPDLHLSCLIFNVI